jgi:hypothetical protein
MSEGIDDALVKQNMVGDNKILNQPWARLRAWLRCIGRVDGDGSGMIVMRAHGRFPILKTDAQQQAESSPAGAVCRDELRRSAAARP